MSVPEIDQQIGIEVYATKTAGLGGAIRRAVEDFVVDEVLVDGSKAMAEKNMAKPPLGATETRQRFLLCVLVKRNWDTFVALKNVARQLGIDQNRISFAGIKDAKAITAQHVSIDGISEEDAARVDVKDVELRPIGYVREPLSAFYMQGNNFTAKIKEISYPRGIVEERVAKIASEIAAAAGIPNFYGHQRFGTTRAITHIVGEALVQGNVEQAAMTFLAKPSEYEHPASRQARRDLQDSQDFNKALKVFPVQLRFERLMLAHLVENPGDFSGAFRMLPLKLRMLFVQAWQSFLFNRFLSARIRNGFSIGKAEIGDYVVNVDRSGMPMIRTGKVVDGLNASEIDKLIAEGRMRVSLPIFGVKQKLSEGTMGELEKRILEEEGVEANGFRIPALPEIGGKGELRAAVSPVINFALEAVSSYSNELESQAEVGFMLLRGSYATILLREIMKPSNLISAGF